MTLRERMQAAAEAERLAMRAALRHPTRTVPGAPEWVRRAEQNALQPKEFTR